MLWVGIVSVAIWIFVIVRQTNKQLDQQAADVEKLGADIQKTADEINNYKNDDDK